MSRSKWIEKQGRASGWNVTMEYAAPPFHNSRIVYVDLHGMTYVEADIFFLIDSYRRVSKYDQLLLPTMRIPLYEYLTRTCKGEHPYAILTQIGDSDVADILDHL